MVRQTNKQRGGLHMPGVRCVSSSADKLQEPMRDHGFAFRRSITRLLDAVFFKSITGLALRASLKNDKSKNNKKVNLQDKRQ